MEKANKSRDISKICSKAQSLMQSRKWWKPQEQCCPTDKAFMCSPPWNCTLLLHDWKKPKEKDSRSDRIFPVVTFSGLKIPSTVSIMFL